MDVFGYGTDEPSRPLLPPGTCWICDQSPQQEAMKVIDTRRNSRAEKNGISERKYICEPCAVEMGKAMGQVSAEVYEDQRRALAESQDLIVHISQQRDDARSSQTQVVSVDSLKELLQHAVDTASVVAAEPADTVEVVDEAPALLDVDADE